MAVFTLASTSRNRGTRSNHGFIDSSGRVCIFGPTFLTGTVNFDFQHETVERYDPLLETWTEYDAAPQYQQNGGGFWHDASDRIYMWGGQVIADTGGNTPPGFSGGTDRGAVWDPVSGHWSIMNAAQSTPLGSYQGRGQNAAGYSTATGEAWILIGTSSSGTLSQDALPAEPNHLFKNVLHFSGGTGGTWSTGTTLIPTAGGPPGGDLAPNEAVHSGSRIYLFSQGQYYDTAADSWATFVPLTSNVANRCIGPDGRVWSTLTSFGTTSLFVFDPSTNRQTFKQTLNSLAGVGAGQVLTTGPIAFFAGYLVLFGWQSVGPFFTAHPEIIFYDEATNRFLQSGESMPVYSQGATLVNDGFGIYVINPAPVSLATNQVYYWQVFSNGGTGMHRGQVIG